MPAWIVTRTHMTVMMTADPIRGLSVPRDTKQAFENVNSGENETRTGQIKRYKIGTRIYSIDQHVEDVSMEGSR